MEEKRHKGKVLLSVDRLANIISNHIDGIGLGYFWLDGEVQNLRDTHMHLYFTVVSKNKSIRCIIWDSIKVKNNIRLENGYKGKFMGKLNYYESKNDISMVIYSIDLEGIGNMYNELEATKKYCHDNGFFKKEKKPIDSLKSMLIITRYDSAAYNDIIHTLEDCYNIKVYIQDSYMQGDNAKKSIIDNILLAEKLSTKIPIDAIVITRGGGSIDDLWVFNDKNIVERIYKCKIPVITAIGHDIDTSLCDIVADKSFITPTEFARYINKLYSKKDNILRLEDMKMQLSNILSNKAENVDNNLDRITSDLNIDSLVSVYNEKISWLEYNRRILKNSVETRIKNRILGIDKIKHDVVDYVNSLINIKMYTLDNKIITNNKNIKDKTEYIMDFNGKKFVVRIMG
tara:strand:- start:1800 stop:2999 length:1200 start_codon:yes stop_codon:yes gene_type:complete